MLFFGKKKSQRTLSFGLGGYKFISDDKYISYKSVYGRSFRVLKSDIETVGLDEISRSKYRLNIIGKGVVLTHLDIVKPWAEKAQDFIIAEISDQTP